MTDRTSRDDGGTAADGRRVWPLVVGALIAVGLLIGGGIALAGGGTDATPPAVSPSVSASPSPASVDQAQLAGAYRVTIVVRTARNLASLVGIDLPVPGSRLRTTWRFFPTCSTDTAPCATSWEGHRPPLFLKDGIWSGTIAGPRAPCLDGGRVEAPIELRLAPQDALVVGDGWFVRSFAGTSSVSFRCPGFAPSSGVVDVTAFRV